MKGTVPFIAALALSLPAASAADQKNPLAEYLEAPGAKTTLPVKAAKSPWPFNFSKSARENFAGK